MAFEDGFQHDGREPLRDTRSPSRCQVVETSTGPIRVQGNGKPLSAKATKAIDALVAAIKQKMRKQEPAP
jgi:hypothetical protein